MTVRTPDGKVYDDGELERGKTCIRCGEFVKVRSQDELPAKKATADRYKVVVKGYAARNPDHHAPRPFEDISGVFCSSCREELEAFMGGEPLRPPRAPIREWVEDHFPDRSDEKEEITDEIVEAVAEYGAEQ